MAHAGQSYVVVLKKAHLDWGEHRHTNTRDRIEGESYIQIPSSIANEFNIRRGDTYDCISSDGLLNTVLRAAGSQSDGIHAKQFESDGNLKILGSWLHNDCHAQVGDSIEVRWVSPDDIMLTYCQE